MMIVLREGRRLKYFAFLSNSVKDYCSKKKNAKGCLIYVECCDCYHSRISHIKEVGDYGWLNVGVWVPAVITGQPKAKPRGHEFDEAGAGTRPSLLVPTDESKMGD
jgi:hypothetical protein